MTRFCKRCALNEVRIEKDSHVQITGMAMYDTHEGKHFVQMEPAVPVAGMMEPFSGTGRVMVMSDGSMEAILTHRKRTEATLLQKLPHGRLSLTKRGMVQLTLVFDKEELGIPCQLSQEASTAARAIMNSEL